ncbi:MAG: GTP pyrophosphokinase [Eubacterium sp.]|nr:bifunctional (p)ppGpp synthetase/guanosine-3',5'-bis(diphosphate) 3'-pyrophosphohydrolase [Eubacterium sp.]MCR4846293.1 GTP pyrophosphokinase [Eubacterium sp.]
MIYTDMTKLAMRVAYKAHDGQVDRTGVPYIYHPIHLAEQMDSEDACVVALLHDVVEDSDITLEDLREMGFSEAQLEGVRLMTHIPPSEDMTESEKLEDYLDYVRRIKSNALARQVKLADLRHNSDPGRQLEDTEINKKRLEKYKKALEILN